MSDDKANVTSLPHGQADLPQIGIWIFNDGAQILELLFRSDGRYQLETKSIDPIGGSSFTERGRCEFKGPTLELAPYDYIGEPQAKRYEFQIAGNSLTLTAPELGLTQVYEFKAGSRDDVLQRQKMQPGLIGAWARNIQFWGRDELTFRPGGYYIRKSKLEGSESQEEVVRGRYVQDGGQFRIHPYQGIEVAYEIDFFGNTLTLIKND